MLRWCERCGTVCFSSVPEGDFPLWEVFVQQSLRFLVYSAHLSSMEFAFFPPQDGQLNLSSASGEEDFVAPPSCRNIVFFIFTVMGQGNCEILRTLGGLIPIPVEQSPLFLPVFCLPLCFAHFFSIDHVWFWPGFFVATLSILLIWILTTGTI